MSGISPGRNHCCWPGPASGKSTEKSNDDDGEGPNAATESDGREYADVCDFVDERNGAWHGDHTILVVVALI